MPWWAEPQRHGIIVCVCVCVCVYVCVCVRVVCWVLYFTCTCIQQHHYRLISLTWDTRWRNSWIFHAVDQCSKFNFAYGIPRKQIVDVASVLNTNIFPYFGVPRILQSDNGSEFINQVIEALLRTWHSVIQLITGRPHHPQSQALVKRVYYTLERKLTMEISKAKLKQPQ